MDKPSSGDTHKGSVLATDTSSSCTIGAMLAGSDRRDIAVVKNEEDKQYEQ